MNLLNLLPADMSFSNSPLKDAPLLVYDKLKFASATEVSIPVIDKNLFLQLEQKAGFTVCVINNEKDLNEELKTAYLNHEELNEFLKDHALISYSLYGKIQSNGNLQVSDVLGFEIGANRSVELSQITTHNKEITVNEALLTDLKDYKNLLTHSADSGFWDTLKPHDSLTCSLVGDLDFEFSVNILKLLSVAFAPVFSLTSRGPKVPLKIDSSLGIRFKAIKNDSFSLLIAKRNDNSFKLSLKKNRLKNKNINITGGLSISLLDADAQTLTGIINGYFEKYLGKPVTEIERILEQAEEIRQDSFLIRLAEKIAFNGNGIEELREQFDTYKSKISDTQQQVLNIVSDTIKAGIEYEYRKVQSDGVLLEALLSKDVLTSEIQNLVKLNVSNLIAKARNNGPGIDLESYLTEKSLTIEERFSFGISLGNWALKSASQQIYQNDEKNIGLLSRRAVKLAFLDEKEVTNFGEESTIQASLDAETPNPATILNYNDLEYALTLILKKTDQRIHVWDKRDLHRFLQTALTWDIFKEEELGDFFESIWDNLLKNKNVEYECKLHIPETVFPQTIKALSNNATMEAITEAMAGSILPNNADDRSLLISARKEFYSPLISDAFQGKDIMKTFKKPLYTEKYKTWRNFEITQIRNQDLSATDSFMGIANNRTFRHFQKLVSGINLLNENIQKQKTLEENLEGSALKFFFDTFHATVKDHSGFAQRWLGHFIMQSIAKESPETLESIVNTLTIIYPDENNKKEALLIGG
jgi:hypothetical protein